MDDIGIRSGGRQIYEKIFDLKFGLFAKMLNSDDGDKKLAKLIKISEAIDLKSGLKIDTYFCDKLFKVVEDGSLNLESPNFFTEASARFEHYGLPIKFSIKSAEDQPSAQLAGASASLQGGLSPKKPIRCN